MVLICEYVPFVVSFLYKQEFREEIDFGLHTLLFYFKYACSILMKNVCLSENMIAISLFNKK